MFMSIDFFATRRDEAVTQVLFSGLARLFRVTRRDHGLDRRADLSKDYHYFLSFSCLSRCQIANQSNLHGIPRDVTK